MVKLSHTSLRTASDFATKMGLVATPGPDGSVTFLFEQSGLLSLTPSSSGNAILISLAAVPRRKDGWAPLHALEKAGLDPTTTSFLHAGLTRQGEIVFATSVEEQDFDLPRLELCLQRLKDQHAALS